MAPITLNAPGGPAGTAPPGAGQARLRCLIVDDNEGFLSAARAVLESEGIAVCGGASTAAQGIQLARDLCPDVVLVDIVLGQDDGFELARRLSEDDHEGTRTVLLISTHAGADFADMVARSPAAGFLAKAELSAAAITSAHRRAHSEGHGRGPGRASSPYRRRSL